jgi:lysophospholipase L1-like esterase
LPQRVRRWLMIMGVLLVGAMVAGTKDFSHAPALAAEGKITVFIAGDSTASNYDAARAPRTGWGQVLQTFFTGNVVVRNEAVSGRSSKSFITEGYLRNMTLLFQPGDYLLIQFGHNDEKKGDEARYTEPFTTFKVYLTQYIAATRKAGATPVLLTPVNRRSFNADGSLKLTHGDYPQVMIDLGRELNVPVIDVTAKSKLLFEQMGPEGTKRLFLYLQPGENPNYPQGVADDTHLQLNGAMEVARMVMAGIRELDLPLAKELK